MMTITLAGAVLIVVFADWLKHRRRTKRLNRAGVMDLTEWKDKYDRR